jgi:hypothetical protein
MEHGLGQRAQDLRRNGGRPRGEQLLRSPCHGVQPSDGSRR